MNKIAKIIIVLVLIAAAIFASRYFFSVFQPGGAQFVQYVGRPQEPCGTWALWFSTKEGKAMLDSSEVVIGDYKFVVSKHDIQNSYGCETCTGTTTSIDKDNCQHWMTAALPAGYICTKKVGCMTCRCYCNGVSMGSGGYCSSNTGDTIGTTWVYRAYVPSKECGGLKLTQTRGTSYTVNVYYKGVLNTTLGKSESSGSNLTSSSSYDNDYVHAFFGSSMVYCYGSFVHMQNEYSLSFKPTDFDISISSPKTHYFQGENASVEVKVRNDISVPVEATITLKVCAPTFFGTACNNYVKTAPVQKGESTLSYTIPTANVVDKLDVTPSVSLKVKAGGIPITGVNYDCNGDGFVEAITSDCTLGVGSITGDTYTLMVVPRPIYIETIVDCITTNCPEGYTCQAESGLCLRTDVIENKLACQQLGCPIINNTAPYECSSAGVCVQTIFVYLNCTTKGCPSGYTCENITGTCFNSIIYDKIIQCQTTSDCAKPCDGVSISCVDKKCVYEGECNPSAIGCRELGCGGDYKCDMERNVCIKEVEGYNWQIITILGVIIIGIIGIVIWKVRG